MKKRGIDVTNKKYTVFIKELKQNLEEYNEMSEKLFLALGSLINTEVDDLIDPVQDAIAITKLMRERTEDIINTTTQGLHDTPQISLMDMMNYEQTLSRFNDLLIYLDDKEKDGDYHDIFEITDSYERELVENYIKRVLEIWLEGI